MEKRDPTDIYGLLPFGTNLKNVTNKTLKLGDFQFLIIFYLIKQIYKGLCIYLLCTSKYMQLHFVTKFVC